MAKPEWMPTRLYQWVKLRSLGFHLIFLIVAAGCSVAADWQIRRAMEGNVLSYLYSVEWPAIAIVVGVGWWLLVHDTPEDIARRTEYHRRMRAASAEVVARTLPRSALAVTVGSEEVASRALGGPAARALGAGSGAGDGEGSSPAGLVLSGANLAARGGEDPETRLLPPVAGGEDELDDYNRYLATLAVRGRAKTWRNPRGL